MVRRAHNVYTLAENPDNGAFNGSESDEGKNLNRVGSCPQDDSANIACKEYLLYAKVNKNTGMYICPCAHHQSC